MSERIGEVEFDRPEDERHATIWAAAGYDGDDPVEITRDEARALAAVLTAYADSPDPGPGAPYPLPKPLTPEESDALWRSWRDNVSRGFAEKLDAGLHQAAGSSLGNGALIPRMTLGIETTRVRLGLCDNCGGDGRVFGGMVRCPACDGDGVR
jgi:hypothetical protein